MRSRFCFSVFQSSFLACAHAQSLIPMVQLRAGSCYMGGLGLNENFDERPLTGFGFFEMDDRHAEPRG